MAKDIFEMHITFAFCQPFASVCTPLCNMPKRICRHWLIYTFLSFYHIPWTLLSSERMNFLIVHHLTNSPCLRCNYMIYWLCTLWWYTWCYNLSISAGVCREISFKSWQLTERRLFGKKRWSSERACQGKGRIVRIATEKEGRYFCFCSQDKGLYPPYHV